jgi:hypothetical protein
VAAFMPFNVADTHWAGGNVILKSDGNVDLRYCDSMEKKSMVREKKKKSTGEERGAGFIYKAMARLHAVRWFIGQERKARLDLDSVDMSGWTCEIEADYEQQVGDKDCGMFMVAEALRMAMGVDAPRVFRQACVPLGRVALTHAILVGRFPRALRTDRS